jgi:ATP-dependent Clp protease adaptor protein ClpS
LGIIKIFKLVEEFSPKKIEMMSTKEKTSEEVLLKEEVKTQNEIVLYNDEINTFDHVIETLIHACDHTAEQAEQCSLIVHYKGKCTVKTGLYDDLKPRCSVLLKAGLSAEII